MPTQFSNKAANADVMGQDANGTGEGLTDAIGADGTPRDRCDRTRQVASAGENAGTGEGPSGEKEADARPGQDINAAGFVKDKDAAKP